MERQECQIFSRCCGWLVPRHAMNPGKRSERADMKVYDVDTSMKHEIKTVALEQQYNI